MRPGEVVFDKEAARGVVLDMHCGGPIDLLKWGLTTAPAQKAATKV